MQTDGGFAAAADRQGVVRTTEAQMDFGDLLEQLFKPESRTLQRWLGSFLTLLGLAYIVGGGFGAPVDGNGIPLSPGWFREIFVVLLSLVFFLGVALLVAGFRKRPPSDSA